MLLICFAMLLPCIAIFFSGPRSPYISIVPVVSLKGLDGASVCPKKKVADEVVMMTSMCAYGGDARKYAHMEIAATF